MEFRLLSEDEIIRILLTELPRDFHPSEVKPPELIRRRIAEGRYFARGLFDKQTLLAYSYFARTTDFLLLDYLAVGSNTRGIGIGSITLKYISQMPELTGNRLMLEVEDPDFAADEKDRIMRLRRMDFYLRNGMHNLGVKTRVQTDDYILLGPQPIQTEVVKSAICELYRALFPPEFSRRHILIK